MDGDAGTTLEALIERALDAGKRGMPLPAGEEQRHDLRHSLAHWPAIDAAVRDAFPATRV